MAMKRKPTATDRPANAPHFHESDPVRLDPYINDEDIPTPEEIADQVAWTRFWSQPGEDAAFINGITEVENPV